jgi:hypothetical protein
VRRQTSASTIKICTSFASHPFVYVIEIEGLGDLLSQEVCPATGNASIRAGPFAGRAKAIVGGFTRATAAAYHCSQIVNWNIQPD